MRRQTASAPRPTAERRSRRRRRLGTTFAAVIPACPSTASMFAKQSSVCDRASSGTVSCSKSLESCTATAIENHPSAGERLGEVDFSLFRSPLNAAQASHAVDGAERGLLHDQPPDPFAGDLTHHDASHHDRE